MLETWFIQVSNFQKSACSITYISKKILPTVDEHMLDYVVRFCFKCTNEQGILSSIPSLEVGIEANAVRITSFRQSCVLLV